MESVKCAICADISTHYLTQRQTIRSRCLIPSVRIFQLTTSRRGRPEAASSSIPTDSFQLTTSRRGRLYLRKDGIIMYLISTHYLTQRQTDVLLFPSQDLYISTHYLTQRQTAVPPFVIRFAGFQLTTSRRGRQSSWLYIFFIFSISTHYLTQRQTVQQLLQVLSIGDFNSLPHAEVDIDLAGEFKFPEIFQLTTSRRGRPLQGTFILFLLVFQLTTSRRGRQCSRSFPAAVSNFNSLPHAEVDSNLSQNLWTLTIDSITNRIINLCFLL